MISFLESSYNNYIFTLLFRFDRKINNFLSVLRIKPNFYVQNYVNCVDG